LPVLQLRSQTIKRSRFSEEQITGILKEHQAGLGAKELSRKHGVSDATYYKWPSKRLADAELRTRMKDRAAKRRRFGYSLPDRASRGNVPKGAIAHPTEAQGIETAHMIRKGQPGGGCP
jgi:putative transposase